VEPEIVPLQWLLTLEDKVSRPLQSLHVLQNKFMDGVSKLKKLGHDMWTGWFKDTEDATKKTGVFKGILDKVIESFKNLAGLLKSVGGLLVAAAVAAVAFGVSMVKAAVEHHKGLLLLNQALNMTGKQLGVVAGLTDKWWANLGYTREEALAVARLGLEYGILAKRNTDAAKNMRLWTDQTMIFARATGTSTAAVGKFHFQLAEVYQLGYERLQRFGSAMKYVGDKTAISHEELLGFNESLDSLLMLSGKTDNSLMNYGIQFKAVEGHLSNFGITFSRVYPALAKMMKIGEGGVAVTQLGQAVGMTARDIRDLIQSHPEKLPSLIGQAVRGFESYSSARGQMQYSRLSESLGIDAAELAKYGRKGVAETEAFVRESLKHGGKGMDDHGRAARKTVDAITQAFASLEKQIKLIWISMGEKLIPVIERHLLPLMSAFGVWLNDNAGMFTQFIDDVITAIEQAVVWGQDFWDADWETRFKMIAEPLSEWIATAFRWGIEKLKAVDWLALLKTGLDISTAIGALVWKGLQSGWTQFTDWVSGRGGEKFLRFFEGMHTAMIDEFIQALEWWATESPNEIRHAWRKAFGGPGLDRQEAVKDNPVMGNVMGIGNPLAQDMDAMDAVLDWMGGLFTSAEGNTAALTDKIGAKWQATMLSMTKDADAAFAKITRTALDAKVEMAGASPGGFLEKIGFKWKSILQSMLDETKKATDTIPRTFSDMTHEIAEGFKTSSLGTGLSALWTVGTQLAGAAGKDQSGFAKAHPEFDPFIAAASKQFNIQPEVFKAWIARESGFNPNAKNGKHWGLLQISPEEATTTAKQLGWASDWNRLDPEKNIMAGGAILRGHLDRTSQDLGAALGRFRWGGGSEKSRTDPSGYASGILATASALGATSLATSINGVVAIDDRRLLLALESIRQELVAGRGRTRPPGKGREPANPTGPLETAGVGGITPLYVGALE